MIDVDKWNSSASDGEYPQRMLGVKHAVSANHTDPPKFDLRDSEMLARLAELWKFENMASTSCLIEAKSTIKAMAELTIKAIKSSAAFTPEVFWRNGPAQQKFRAYTERIRELCGYAAEDGYGLREMSLQDFWRFVMTEPDIRPGSLVLGDNGNLRAVWRDGKGTHLGLQFLGAGLAQYVIFKKREAASVVSRVAGRDTFDGLKRQIDAFDLFPLLCP